MQIKISKSTVCSGHFKRKCAIFTMKMIVLVDLCHTDNDNIVMYIHLDMHAHVYILYIFWTQDWTHFNL